MRRAYLLARLDALRTMREQRVVDLTFARPRAVEVCQQVTACLDGQRRRIEAVQHDAALLPVADDCVRRDDVLLGIGRIDEFDVERLVRVGQLDDGSGDIRVGQRSGRVRHVAQFGIHVAVGMGHAQGGFTEVAAAHRRVGEVVGAVIRAAVALDSGHGCRVVDTSSEMVEQDFAVGSHAHDHRRSVGLDVDDLRFRGSCAGADQARKQACKERFQGFVHDFM